MPANDALLALAPQIIRKSAQRVLRTLPAGSCIEIYMHGGRGWAVDHNLEIYDTTGAVVADTNARDAFIDDLLPLGERTLQSLFGLLGATGQYDMVLTVRRDGITVYRR